MRGGSAALRSGADKAKAPVFFILGGEGPIAANYVDGTHFIVNEWAGVRGAARRGRRGRSALTDTQEFGAAVVTLEHRFYGQVRGARAITRLEPLRACAQSVPFNDSSTANLRYLSSRQSLADAAAFKDFLTTTQGFTGP